MEVQYHKTNKQTLQNEYFTTGDIFCLQINIQRERQGDRDGQTETGTVRNRQKTDFTF